MKMFLAIFWGLLLFGSAEKQILDDNEFTKQERELDHDKHILKTAVEFEVHYKFSLPYVATIQSQPLVYDVKLWFNNKTGNYRMDTLDDTNKLITTEGATYTIVPALQNTTFCMLGNNEELQRFHQILRSSTNTLPTRSGGWKFVGVISDKGDEVLKWEKQWAGLKKVNKYTYYTTKTYTPLFLEALGVDYFSGAHFNNYVAEFTYFKAGPIDASVFEEPDYCEGDKAISAPGIAEKKIVQASQLIPSVLTGGGQGLGKASGDYIDFVKDFPRSFSGKEDYVQREQIFLQNKQYVEEWNKAHPEKHTLALNKFADWTDEEFTFLMLGRTPGKARPDEPLYPSESMDASVMVEVSMASHLNHTHKYEPLVPLPSVPSAVSWKGTPAGGIVKDQAVCGSCWTFGAAGGMEAAWYLATGEQVTLSEQQVVDCSWAYNVYGCSGGLVNLAMEYLIDNGGIHINDDYQYVGQDYFCQSPDAQKLQFKGYAWTPERNSSALKEALYSRGPLAVSLDASGVGFRFYSSGVYSNPQCCDSHYCLDHSVTLVGYGIEDGEEYWLIKNSWTPHWGDEGYIKISMEHDCGITLDAIYMFPDVEGTVYQQALKPDSFREVMENV